MKRSGYETCVESGSEQVIQDRIGGIIFFGLDLTVDLRDCCLDEKNQSLPHTERGVPDATGNRN